jgi:hypothetical protein
MNAPAKYVSPPVTDRIVRVMFIIQSYTSAPRRQDTDQLADLELIQAEALQQLQQIIDVHLLKFNQSLHKANLPAIQPPKAAPER